VVDVVGGADLLHSVASLRYGGRIALLGLLDKEDKPVSLTQPLLYGGKTSKLLLKPCGVDLSLV
jgi:NADPH:quinone reductase-like Zn-dependent oxidoreductase